MLYIFDSTEKLITTLPKGSFFDAVHSEVLNGENTFEFTIPTGSDYVVEGNLVAFRDLDSYWQVFEVKRIVDVHGDGLTRTAYCEHIFYELLDNIVTDKRPSADATAALAGMLDNTRWQVGIVDDLGASSTSAYYESALSAVQKVANAWKGELNWRCVITGGVITRYVDLLGMRGTDTGKQFAYTKDILSIEREVDSSGVVTALYGRGKGIELDSGGYGRRLTFADVVADDKPAGQEWVGDADALAQWGRPGNRHRFDVFVDEEETDPAKLLQKTRDELGRRKVPRATYRLDVVSLEELTGYEHEKVRLGDMVRVIDREFKPELVVSARVIEIERDILDPANTKVVLGSFAPTIVEATINTARRVNEMANKPYNTKWLDGKISVLQNAIENTQSYVFQTGEEGILILDAPTYDQATKAMKLGGGIFAIANQKDGQGGWNWRTFGDGSGFTADLITAGMIDAGLVQIGPQTTFAPGYDPVDNHVYFQYSANGTSWHDTFNPATDKYMRQKVGDSGTWSDPMRVVGEDGPTGPAGQDGAPGAPGQDGTSSYLWIRYSQNANGNPMTTDPTGAKYIGVATTTTASAPSSYASYSWSLIKGTDGIKGEKGDDGQTSYLHIKYSDDGVNFTANNGEDVGAWIGTYVDFIQEDSTIFNDYTWNKVRGEDGKTPVKGADYFDGVDGQDGISSYLWIKYSADADGTNFSDTPNTYMGVAVTTTPTAPTLKTAYRWTKVVGTDGIPGEAGADGQTSYLHIKYSDDGVNFTGNGGEDVGAYIGTYVDFIQADSTNFGDYTWNKVKGEDGQDVRKFTSQPMPPYDVGDLWIGGSDGKNTQICVSARASGSFVASDFGLITETPASMGVDADCVGLWHFDGSLNSHKGVAAIGDANFDTGCFGQAVNVEEGTTNLISNPDFEVDTAGWDTWQTSIERVTTEKWSGNASLKVTLTGTKGAAQTDIALSSPVAGTIYTGSFYVKGAPGKFVQVLLRLWGGASATSDLYSPAITCDGTWQRIIFSRAIDYSDRTMITLAFFSDGNAVGDIYYVDGFQLEQKPYATPFVNGTRLGVLKAPTTGLSASQGTISFRAKNLAESVNGSVLIDLPKSDNTQGLRAGIANDGKLYISNLESTGATVYGPNKSTLTGWDSISLAWKPERLSLVVNDEEACYIENPGLPTALGSHIFIGTDRNGNNAINTLVDELRIDKVYREVNIRTGWHKTGVPFYTSEDMKQWPGYMRLETDGLKVYDSSDALRVLVGSWMKGLIRKYGIKIIDGEIYSSLIRSGAEDATEYIQLVPPNSLQVWHNSKVQMNIHADYGARIDFFRDAPDAEPFNAVARITGGYGGADLGIMAVGDTGKVAIGPNLHVTGSITKDGTVSYIEPTLNYGSRLLYIVETPELLYYDRGVTYLTNGEATVKLDPIFLECIEPDTDLTPWQVWVECYGDNSVYVADVGEDYFIVKERNGGTSNNKIIWRLEATRKNYAGIRLMEVVD